MKILAVIMPLIGIGFFIFMFVFSVRRIKDKGSNFVLLKNWSAISHPQKKGDMATGTLLSWQQTSTMNNFDYFFIFTFEANIEGDNKKYEAAAVLRVSDISKLKKGLPLVLKYVGEPPTKIAVMDVIYNNEG